MSSEVATDPTPTGPPAAVPQANPTPEVDHGIITEGGKPRLAPGPELGPKPNRTTADKLADKIKVIYHKVAGKDDVKEETSK